jgi:hypothetical protein
LCPLPRRLRLSNLRLPPSSCPNPNGKWSLRLPCRQAELMVRALNLNLNPRVGLTHHLPVSFTADAMNIPSRFSTTHHRRSSPQMKSVTLSDIPSSPLSNELYEQETVSTPSSFPSIMSLQTLTNWWSPGSTAAACSPTVKQSTPNYVRNPKVPLKKYVSKERQLEKLRRQLDQERKSNRCSQFQVDVCRACGTGQVSL